jgi:CubicO group peptidase (beta-lactamase class C family)
VNKLGIRRLPNVTEVAARVDGVVAPGFEPVRDAFVANFERGEVGASCCVYAGGEAVVDIWGGTLAPGSDEPYTDRHLQLVASATKGAMAILGNRLAEQGKLDFDAPVRSYWPEFGTDIPVRWLFSHQAGLVSVDAPLGVADFYAWTPAVEALAEQEPYWEPGTAHGYHAWTYGWLVGELLKRITGRTPGQLLAEEIAGPLGIDFFVGLPDEQAARVARLHPAPPTEPPDRMLAALMDPNGLAYKAFLVPNGMLGVLNDPDFLRAEVPAANGMASARALARMYAACLGEVGGARLLQPETVAAARVPHTTGADRVLGFQSRFGLGFQLSFPERPMAGDGSFGHYGLGGSVGFAHPERGFAFGYTVNQMLPGGTADPRSVALIEATLGCL